MATIEDVEEALAFRRVDEARTAARAFLGLDSSEAKPPGGPALTALGEALARQYRDFNAAAVAVLADGLAAELGDDRAAFLKKPYQADIDLTAEWAKRLESLTGERLTNDIQERVKSDDMAGARASAAALLDMAATPDARSQRARYLGALLGTMVMEKARAEALLRDLSRAGSAPTGAGDGAAPLDTESAIEAQTEFARANAAAARRERPAASMARQELTQATVELGRALPSRTSISATTADDIAKFDATARAIVRAALASARHERLADATMLFAELSPKEVSAAGAMAGVEQRLHTFLGRTARGAASAVMQGMGQAPGAYVPYFAFAKSRLHSGRVGRMAVEVLGLMANPEAVPFLIEAMGDRKAEARTEAVFALGSYDDPRALNTLTGELDRVAKGRLSDAEPRREAFNVISALGRGTRTAPVEQRTRVAAQVIRALPPGDIEFHVRAALNFFLGKLDGMDQRLLDWAAQVAITAIWNADRPELARAARGQALGFRQPLVDLLIRLAPFAMPAALAAAEKHAPQYGGAYLAMAEFLAKAKDPQALPLLRQLLTNTFLHDDSAPKSQYTKEQVYDAATEQKVDLEKDQVVATLVFAIDQIGTPESEEALAELFERIQAGTMPRPGRETADILMRAHTRNEAAHGRSVFKGGGGTGEGGDAGDANNPAAAPEPVTADDLQAVKDLTASYLFAGKRREKKIGAMIVIARRKVSEGVATLVDHLSDKDPIIAASALTAVSDFAGGGCPAAALGRLHDALLTAMRSGDGPSRVKAVEALSAVGPKRSPLKEKLEALRAIATKDLALRAMIDRLAGPPAVAAGAAGANAQGSGEHAGPGAAPAADPAAKAQQSMDAKRQHMLARQAWIKAGKKGPEPAPPG